MNRFLGLIGLSTISAGLLSLSAVEAPPFHLSRPVLTAPDELFNHPNRYPLQREDLDQLFPRFAVRWVQQGSTRLAVVVSADRCFYYAGGEGGQLAAQYRVEAVWLDAQNQPLKQEALGPHLAKENPKLRSTISRPDGTLMTRASDFGMRVREIREKPAAASALRVTLFRHLPEGKAAQEFKFALP